MINQRQALAGVAGMALAGAALVLAAPAAQAFRPSSRWLVDQAVARHLQRKVTTLRVDQEVTGSQFGPEGAAPVTGRVLVRAPDGLRVERLVSEGESLEIWGPKKLRIVKPNEGEIKKKARPDVFYAFFTVGASIERRAAADRLTKALTSAKIDLDVVSYVRFDSRINYLIGCKPWEVGEKPSLSLDKDTLVPTRIVTFHKGASGPVRVEVHLKGWGSPEGGSWFPKVIERYRTEGKETKLVERAVTRTVEKNEAIDKALFAVR